MVKNIPAVWETWVWSLGWEDPLEEGMAIHSSTLAWRTPSGQGSLAGYSPWGHKQLDMTKWLSTAYTHNGKLLSHKKEQNAIFIYMDRPWDDHTKWSKEGRERQVSYGITFVKAKIRHKWTYLWNSSRLTDIQNRIVAAKGEGWLEKSGLEIWG